MDVYIFMCKKLEDFFLEISSALSVTVTSIKFETV